MNTDIKRQFNKVKSLCAKLRAESFKLDRMIDEEWGFSYSDTDDDPMIDTLDHATQSISFEEFKKRMDQYRKNKEETGNYGCII